MIRFIVAIFISTLMACTSEETQLQELSVEGAQNQLRMHLRELLDEKFKGKNILKSNYCNRVVDRTQFEVLSLSKTGSTAQAKVRVKTVPENVRTALTEIMAKLDPAKENNFNVPDALSMIYRHLAVDPNTFSEQEFTVDLVKNGDWQVKDPPRAQVPLPPNK